VKCFPVSRLQVTVEVMMARPDNLIAQLRVHAATATLAISMVLIGAAAGWPQAASPPPSASVKNPAVQDSGGGQPPTQQSLPPQVETAPSSAAPAQENGGVIEGIGKIFDKFPTLKSPQEAIDDFNARAREAAKDASDSLSRLAKPSSMASGRMICPASVNGAPDCKLAADNLCKSKGFQEGKSLNTDSSETCSPKVLIPGRTRKPDDCRTDNYVTRALCQ
jgi:hypothetical protein